MSGPRPTSVLHRVVALVCRVAASPVFWGLLGWLLLVLRYASEVVHPRYGG